ncbi:protein of unknown function (plasmid) [Paraburkholderia dioscoreae]|uniref:Uncharacterized protein n=1 Tax=Paraburkholderia dioscoreae TaxID=2604047 RepID=A0A5Q4Z9H1_9BURK|nr:protein of unknown function [Paraburkholderia dioscoreae]
MRCTVRAPAVPFRTSRWLYFSGTSDQRDKCVRLESVLALFACSAPAHLTGQSLWDKDMHGPGDLSANPGRNGIVRKLRNGFRGAGKENLSLCAVGQLSADHSPRAGSGPGKRTNPALSNPAERFHRTPNH